MISVFQNSENSSYEYQVAPDMAMTVRMIMILSSIYFSVQTRKQYIDSLSPLLSFRLYEKSGYLFLRIENTG